MTDKKDESTSKKIGKFLSKTVFDASKIAYDKTRKIAKEEIFGSEDIENIQVKRPERPTDTGRVKFASRVKPMKTYSQGMRTVDFFKRNPEKESLVPSIDGLVSFSVLLAPFALLLGLLLLSNLINEGIAFILLILYLLFIAIPGGYLGLDAILAGVRSAITGGITTATSIVKGIFEFFLFFLRGLVELFLLFVNSLFGFARDAFQTIADYLVFGAVYLLFVAGIVLFAMNINLWEQLSSSLFLLSFVVLLPSLLPASLAHRQYLLWKLNKNSN